MGVLLECSAVHCHQYSGRASQAHCLSVKTETKYSREYGILTHSSHVFKAPLLIWRGLFCPEKGFGMSKAEQERFSLWRNRDYLLLWGGQVISMTGSQVSQLVFPLLILALTHSPAQTGIAAALQSLPYLILSLPAGALVDRWNRKRVMIFCNLGRFLNVASVPLALWMGHLTVVQLYLVSLLEGTLFVFFDLAEVSSLPQVIPKQQLPAANA